ncbi:lysylphosphatidylglycerol synthase transmembrane domain-containing protein [Aquimarina sp. RZ0]|uniref:lysylphosphatidylglycerol synthase transmembrane domain-containing protein n=1 Tax=Aquimarina sp. RZ0 TaxID=2607730 RepID=UPI002107ABF9|nr:lysylphosphatidylglycerol synthase transmembrane domain-containing protein [Aquimarina sp. RZ0]
MILFFLMLYKIGWEETFHSIQKVSFIHICIAVLILWVAFYLKSMRWKLISNSYHIPIGSYKAFKVFFIGLFLANVTPGRLGDFGRLLYIKEELPNQRIGWSSLIMDRLFDLACLIVFSLVAVIYYQINFDILEFPKSYRSIVYWFSGIGIFFLIAFGFWKLLKNKLQSWKEAFQSNDLNLWTTLRSFGITCMSMVLIYGVFNYVAWAMRIEINHIGLFLGTFVLGILSLLPITILGIGVREISLAIIFQLHNLPAEDAIGLSLIIFLLQLISFIPGAVWFYLSPIKLNDLKQGK